MIKSLYIHIPFCNNICSYCDFAKVKSELFDHKKYLDQLFKEFTSLNIENNSLDTIYIGGGTPTSLNDDEFEILLSFFDDRFKNLKEFTVEANPESLSLLKIKLMKKYHVNRVSLGVETTSKEGLSILNRKHNNLQVIECINNLHKYNINNINLDFIYGYPNQDLKMLQDDLDFIKKLDVKHLSFYSLIFEDNTILKIKGYKEIDEDLLVKMNKLINSSLKEMGFIHYEVSNYSKEGYKSLHNLTYWKDNNYYAIGLGASSYINDKRSKNTSSINRYLNGIIKRDIDIVSKNDEKEEFIMLGFRLLDGLDLNEYQKRFDEDFYSTHYKAISKNKEFLNITSTHISIKEEYIFIMDSIVIDFI